ncbi:MAG: class I SAM-dependent methyltransferase [Clostridia bacterium]|nr:class I SAM-dependent methyltransferase [Clostridia bacterium]
MYIPKKSEGLPIIYKKENITKLSFKDNFADVILCVGVIEHIKDYENCLNEIK